MSNYTLGQKFTGAYPEDAAAWCNANKAIICELERDDEGKRVFEIQEVPKNVETPAQIRRRYSFYIQEALDAFARTRSYDNIMAACSYANSTDRIFAAEAACCLDLRDRTWKAGYAILDAIENEGLEYPTKEEFLAQLPTANASWPG